MVVTNPTGSSNSNSSSTNVTNNPTNPRIHHRFPSHLRTHPRNSIHNTNQLPTSHNLTFPMSLDPRPFSNTSPSHGLSKPNQHRRISPHNLAPTKTNLRARVLSNSNNLLRSVSDLRVVPGASSNLSSRPLRRIRCRLPFSKLNPPYQATYPLYLQSNNL